MLQGSIGQNIDTGVCTVCGIKAISKQGLEHTGGRNPGEALAPCAHTSAPPSLQCTSDKQINVCLHIYFRALLRCAAGPAG